MPTKNNAKEGAAATAAAAAADDLLCSSSSSSGSNSDSDDDEEEQNSGSGFNNNDDNDINKEAESGGNDEDEEDNETDFLSDEDMKKLILDVKDFIVPLQDPGKVGKQKKGGGAAEYQYPKLTALAKKYFDLFKKTKLITLSTNATRDKKAILGCILKSRSHMDVFNVNPRLSQHIQGKNAEKIYVIGNDDTGGQKIFITACYSYFSSKVVKQQSLRNGSVAVRVAFCLCHPSLRAAALYWLENRKIRDDLDQAAGTTEEAFGELLLKLYKDATLRIDRPDVMDLPNHDPGKKIDPHSCDFERAVQWIIETWEDYVKPKYKKVLIKWNKLTGNGDRTLPNFINYCNISKDGTGAPITWLVWVYAIDMKADFLLASVSGKRPPGFNSKEAGFGGGGDDVDVSFDNSSNDFGNDSYFTPGKNKKARIDASIASMEERGQKVESLVNKLDSLVSKKLEKEEPKGDPLIEGYAKIEELNKARDSIKADDDFTPNTKEKLLSAFKSRKKDIANDLISKMSVTEEN